MAGALDRADIIAMLATYGDREPAQVPESIDSLELAWLLHQIEQRYGSAVEIDDDALTAMSTVTGAVEVVGELLASAQVLAQAPDV